MDSLFEDIGAGPMDVDAYGLEEEEEIAQEDAWIVIDKYFSEKGLVRQQLDSFDEFMMRTIQELIDDSGEIKVAPEDQFVPGQDVERVSS
jgi:DNA-directed RNA polymerase II subunit RPB2